MKTQKDPLLRLLVEVRGGSLCPACGFHVSVFHTPSLPTRTTIHITDLAQLNHTAQCHPHPHHLISPSVQWPSWALPQATQRHTSGRLFLSHLDRTPSLIPSFISFNSPRTHQPFSSRGRLWHPSNTTFPIPCLIGRHLGSLSHHTQPHTLRKPHSTTTGFLLSSWIARWSPHLPWFLSFLPPLTHP